MPEEKETYTVIAVTSYLSFTDRFLRIRVKRPNLMVASFTIMYPMNLTLSFIRNEVRKEYGSKPYEVEIPYYISEMIK